MQPIGSNRGRVPAVPTAPAAASKKDAEKNSASSESAGNPPDVLSRLLEQATNMSKLMAASNIEEKLRAGKKLSPGEMNYLRQTNSQLYEKAKYIEEERETLERKLKNCKTQSQVRQAFHHAMAAISGGGKTRNGPSGQTASTGMIAAVGNAAKSEAKGIETDFSQMRMAALKDEYKSSAPSGLPEDDEDADALKTREEKERFFSQA